MITDCHCPYCGLAYGTVPESHWCAAGQAARNKHYDEALDGKMDIMYQLAKAMKMPIIDLKIGEDKPEFELDVEDIWADLPICPYCGKTDADWRNSLDVHGHGGLDDGDEETRSCERCDQDYEVKASISYVFRTKKIEDEDES